LNAVDRSLQAPDDEFKKLVFQAFAFHKCKTCAAYAAVGGGFLTDYDVVNVNLPPPPTCAWLPNRGELTAHEGTGIPSVVSGTARAFAAFAAAVTRVDRSRVMAAMGTAHLSDMVVMIYLASLGRVHGMDVPTPPTRPPLHTLYKPLISEESFFIPHRH
jgi:hypothetical protein